MFRAVFVFLKGISIFLLSLMILWMLLVSFILLETGAKYSIVTESGAMACNIPIFTRETWLWVLFELYGLPSIILAASWRTKNFCNEKLHFLRKLN